MKRREFLAISGSLLLSVGLAQAAGGSQDSGKNGEADSKTDSKNEANNEAKNGTKTGAKNANATNFKKPLKVGFLPITDHLLILAQDYFESPQHTFVNVKFSSWPNLAEALRAGAIDLGFVLAPIGLDLRASGAKIKAIANSHTNGSALSIAKDSPIKEIGDLKGKNVAIPSRFSLQYFILEKILNKGGLGLKDIKITDMAPPEMPAALVNKSIDAFIVAEPFGVIADMKNVARPLVYTKDIIPNHTCCNLVAQEWVLNDKQVLGDLKNALEKARDVLVKDKIKAATEQKAIMGHDPKVIDNVLEKDIVSYENLRLDKKMLGEFKDFLVKQKLSRKVGKLNIDDYAFDIFG